MDNLILNQNFHFKCCFSNREREIFIGHTTKPRFVIKNSKNILFIFFPTLFQQNKHGQLDFKPKFLVKILFYFSLASGEAGGIIACLI